MSQIALLVLNVIGRLPLRVLYAFSDLMAVLLHRVVGYRKEVIQRNLQLSFPELDGNAISELTKKYYGYLADLIVETIHLPSMSEASIEKHCRFLNPEVLEKPAQEGRNVIIMMGHSGNWEWAGAATAARFTFKMIPIYRKIKSDAFDTYMRSMRSRFGSQPVLDQDILQMAQELGEPHALAMLADQTPSKRKGIWQTFMHQPTPFYRGCDILAKRLRYDVVFAHVRRGSRGVYNIWLESYSPVTNNNYERLARYKDFLEKEISEQPENWLWSHKRWKHQPEASSKWIDAAK